MFQDASHEALTSIDLRFNLGDPQLVGAKVFRKEKGVHQWTQLTVATLRYMCFFINTCSSIEDYGQYEKLSPSG
jgi:hypothetical protein